MNIIKTFTQFLNLNNAYESFMLNFNKFNPQYDSLEDYIRNLDDPKVVLEIAFDWYRTTQGFNYWSELNSIWYKLLNNEL